MVQILLQPIFKKQGFDHNTIIENHKGKIGVINQLTCIRVF